MAKLTRTELIWLEHNGLEPTTLAKEEHDNFFQYKLDNRHKARYYKDPKTGSLYCIVKHSFVGFLSLIFKMPIVLIKHITEAFVEVFSEFFGYFSKDWCLTLNSFRNGQTSRARNNLS